MPGKNDSLPKNLSDFTVALMQDLQDLRRGKITARDARVRALLAREVLRAVHLQMEGMKYLEGAAVDAQRGISKGKNQ